jgi:hypothetical protein
VPSADRLNPALCLGQGNNEYWMEKEQSTKGLNKSNSSKTKKQKQKQKQKQTSQIEKLEKTK